MPGPGDIGPPYPVGSHADGVLTEGSKRHWQEVRILNKRILADGTEEFYVTYVLFNKRLDTWLRRESLAPLHTHTEGSSEAMRSKRAEGAHAKSSVKYKKSQDDHHGHDVKEIHWIIMGDYHVKTWYASPFPDLPQGVHTLYICPICFKYHVSEAPYKRHMLKCTPRHPPGPEIYRCGNLSFFEVDGRRQKEFCRHLCLFCKLFLDHKQVEFDTDLFLFYMLCEHTPMGFRTVGYFSKELAGSTNILACILTLPQHQKKGFGKVLIDFAYALARKEGRFGGPEEPLSDLGKISFQSYWKSAILGYLYDPASPVTQCTIKDISNATMIQEKDVVNTLSLLNICKRRAGGDEGGVITCPPRKVRYLQHKTEMARLHWAPFPLMMLSTEAEVG
ncbi:MOZ/SAS family [Carpediemonas membranifera]|uniref:Histone acetyltransferase n=1 Tax=Carpediemonas membranifera TaxID=201153 RepID=A0A8J6B6Z3_9EUKA|nr:MOZ/SAS family [Carpediemonas membranifera]|eukprot:KAG9394097.1 MOZ/SAS family [Carpediemonas membranifera]